MQCKKHPRSSPWAYILNLNYGKLAKCNPTFRRDNFFPSSPNIDKSVCTKRFFPKKGKNKSKFCIVNLCNGGTKDFAELWEIVYLKIFPSDK